MDDISKDIEDIFSLLAKIHMIQNHASARFVKVLPHDLTMAQFSVLYHLHKGRTKTPQALAAHFMLSKASIGETLTTLHKKGFVRFEKNKDDRRSKLVSATPAGVKARHEAITAIKPMLTHIRDDVGMGALHEITEKLYPLREWFRDTH